MNLKNLRNIIIAIILGFGLGAICLFIVGIDVGTAYSKLLSSIFGSTKNILNCIIYSTPFLLTALSFSIAYKGGIFNIGVEGEFIISSIATCAVGILFPSVPHIFIIILCLLSGIVASCIYASIIHVLKLFFKIHEIFSMIILNYVALYISNFITSIDIIKSTSGAETTKMISEHAIISFPLEFTTKYNLPQNTNISFFIAVILCIITAIFFKFFPLGHNIENVKFNSEASMQSGINVDKTLYHTYFLSAIIAGIAGSLYVLSITKRVTVLPTFEGIGFTGILIALFSNSNPITIIFASLFFGSLKYAGRSLNIVNAPSQVIDLIFSSIILIAATNFTLKKSKQKFKTTKKSII